ncbi:M4 family metallopeptidase [Nocardioides halotolerans]|uniref:M4 family metallopeptidase n=1 Tax=Nocardioides halotolerans TaxID=433660 RepID=UPI00041C854B|nr:M4 family metallopeptidase [Nocardioides halotolerans]
MHSRSIRIWGAATAALLVAGALGVSAPTATAGTKGGLQTDSTVAARALDALRAHSTELGLTTGQAFRTTDTVLDRSGASHVRMDRTYRGLPVVGGDLVVHQAADGSWAGVSRTLAAPLRMSTTPRLTKTVAQARALRPTKALRGISRLEAKGAPRLVVDAIGHRPRLAWAVTTGGRHADGTPSRLTSYVDARTGAVLRREEGIETVDGTGQSLYSGTVPLKVTQSGSTYQLKDPTRGNTYTTDLNNKTDSIFCQLFGLGCQAGTTFTSTTTTFGNGTTSNRASAGVDAQYGTNETWDYYNQVHGRNGIFGTGAGSYNRTHYGSNYVNAFWDGTKMTYGDGDGVNYGPLVSLDVAGHEMSHGVTENTAKLTYSGESGGLNEATSDIFGSMVEFFANNPNDPGDYLIGEEFDLKNHAGLRRMDNPIADGSSPNCWSTGTKNLDVHYSSGVGNHFFFLLAEGSGAHTINGVPHNSPTCNGSTITGIGRDAAQKIWFRALTVYMTSGTTYSQARVATLNAARDLYGAGSTSYNTVAAAWSAVSVS